MSDSAWIQIFQKFDIFAEFVFPWTIFGFLMRPPFYPAMDFHQPDPVKGQFSTVKILLIKYYIWAINSQYRVLIILYNGMVYEKVCDRDNSRSVFYTIRLWLTVTFDWSQWSDHSKPQRLTVDFIAQEEILYNYDAKTFKPRSHSLYFR